MPKTCEKQSYKIIRVVLCKTPLEKTPSIREIRQFWKLPILQRLLPLQNDQLRSKTKNSKNMRKPILQDYESCSVQKNGWKKHQIFEKWKNFENCPSCKDYSLCKMVSLGQKYKMPKICQKPSYKIIRVFLCKRPLETTSSTRETRQFWLSAILQRL